MPVFAASSAPSASGATVGELVDRVYRDYLAPSDDQPVIVTFAGAVDGTATEWVYADSVLAPDEEDLIGPGVLLEAGSEQARIVSVDDNTNTATVTRGVNGTDAAAHDNGAEIRVSPVFPRRSVFDAVCDNVVGLYPDLWQTATATVTAASGAVDISADVVTIRDAVRLSGTTPVPVTVELLQNYPPSATGSAIRFFGAPAGDTVYVTYEARFTRPTSEDDDLAADFGIDGSWDRIIVVGAAAQVLAGRDLDAVTSEFITEQLEREAFPTGSSQRIRDGLIRYHRFLLDQARRDLRADRTVPVRMSI